MSRFISDDTIRLAYVKPQLGTNSTYTTNTLVDMKLYPRVRAKVVLGDGDATSVTAKLREATTSGGNTEQDITGKAITSATATSDNTVRYIELDAAELTDGYRFVSLDITVSSGGSGFYIYGEIEGRVKYGPATDNAPADVIEVIA